MKIDNWKIYDLWESVQASGLPMIAEYDRDDFAGDPAKIEVACRLANNPTGSGHCNFLSGILVSANVTATNAWWLQLERYHFVQIVSMQSKMHRIKKMIKDGKLSGNEKADNALAEFAEKYKDCDDIETLVYNCPMGLELTGRISTNYLQLKTIYNQRKTHRLKEWRDFCEWIEALPYAQKFIICGQQ